MTLLWTDICFLGMLLMGLLLLLISLRKPPTKLAWLRLLHQPLAVSSGVVLAFFLTIAVLDCLHMGSLTAQDNNDLETTALVSVLDKLVAPIGQHYEKTYSAPLAINLYSTETVMTAQGARQIYPRLTYPPPSLTPDSKKHLIVRILVQEGVISLLLVLILASVLIVGQRYCAALSFYQPSLIAALFTLFVCLFFLLTSYHLSRYLHVFGTGKIGQDIFYYAIKSIRTGLIIGTLTTLFMLPLAITLGIAAGYFGGIIDDVIQYVYITLSSIPGVLLITASVLSMQTYIANHPEQFTTLDQSADARLLALCLILGVTSWTSLCRLLRAETLKLREIDFVLAAIALGSRSWRIIYKHLLPNVMPIVMITLVLDFSFLVLAEAVLSYVGVGVSPMTISWGNMINGARLELAREPIVWWPILAAFSCMFVLVLASNLLADAVRDVFDPQQA